MKARATLCTALLCVAFFSAATVTHAATRPKPSSLTKPAPLVCIDPGHGGPFSNANANGLRERTVNLQIGLALRKSLRARGYRVIMTRTTNTALMKADTQTWNLAGGNLWAYAKDRTLYYRQSIPKDDLTARARVANDAGADLFVSIHGNGAASRRARGVETWASPRDAMGRRIARIMQPTLVSRTGRKNRGAKTADFYVLRWTNMPAVLVESAFITNRYDAAFLKTARGRNRVATGIANGVDRWFASKPLHRTLPRISGKSQPTAAVALSRVDFPRGTHTVVLARSTGAADLPGVPAFAARLGATLLLSSGAMPTTSTIAEVARVNPTRVILIGMRGSLDSTRIAAALVRSGVASSALSSIEATNRAALAVRIATRMGAPGGGRVILVNAKDTGAKLAAAPIAARTGSPILLTTETTLGPAAAYLSAQGSRVSSVLRLGSKYRPARYAGPARQRALQYKDSANLLRVLNNETYTSTAAGSLIPLVASAKKPGDVLTASLSAARRRQPVVLVSGTRMSPYARLYLTNKRKQTKSFRLLESNGSLPPIVDAMLAKADCYY